jgi:F420-non-reducing hydrogenase large subunit
MTRQILIEPVTRLEGHGRIDIRLDDAGNVARAFFQVPDFKGFEKFCEGRAAEEMPALTQKICGVCPYGTPHRLRQSAG